MNPRHLILATAGHVDHGKTALIKALTGTDTDRLPEGKARGITIDLGFAHLGLPGFSLGVIDVPGHEDFVRNMIAGVGSIDLTLLVVAGDDGWMPQTEEHLQILDYLGVARGVVAVTKSDLGQAARVEEQVRERLRGSSLGDAPIVLTSVRDGTGIDELKEALRSEAEAAPPPRHVGKPRLFVDRAFTVQGAGTVVTGTLTGGPLARGDAVTIQPQNRMARVRVLQSHNQSVEVAWPGTRVALNLPDVRLEEVPRGTVITTASSLNASRTLDVSLRRSSRSSARPLKNGALMQVHYGSGRQSARVRLLDQREIAAGEKAIARVTLASPVFAFAGDRFILRDASERATIAGGVVLDPEPINARFRSPRQRDLLRERATAPNDLRVLLRSQLQRDGFAQSEQLLLKSNFSREEIAGAIAASDRFLRDGLVADAQWWRELTTRAAKAIDTAHAARPHEPGLPLLELRTSLALNDDALFAALVGDLCERDFARVKEAIRRRTHRPSLPPQLQAAGAAIRTALAAKPFDPPARKELAQTAAAQSALRFLAQNGEVVLVSEELALGAAAFDEMKRKVGAALRAHPATTSELRQLLGTTRRVLVPLLEHFDKIGLTIRDGDRRRLRAPR